MSAGEQPGNGPDAERIADNIERTVDKTALRRVRGLVDELETEQRHFNAQQKWALGGGLALLLMVLVFVSTRKSSEVPEAKRLECEQRAWAAAHAAGTSALRHRHPDMTHVEIQRRMALERDALLLQARKACENVSGG